MVNIDKMKLIRAVIVLLTVVFLYFIIEDAWVFYFTGYEPGEILEPNKIEDICTIVIYAAPP